MFVDYAARGDAFRIAVAELPSGGGDPMTATVSIETDSHERPGPEASSANGAGSPCRSSSP